MGFVVRDDGSRNNHGARSFGLKVEGVSVRPRPGEWTSSATSNTGLETDRATTPYSCPGVPRTSGPSSARPDPRRHTGPEFPATVGQRSATPAGAVRDPPRPAGPLRRDSGRRGRSATESSTTLFSRGVSPGVRGKLLPPRTPYPDHRPRGVLHRPSLNPPSPDARRCTHPGRVTRGGREVPSTDGARTVTGKTPDQSPPALYLFESTPHVCVSHLSPRGPTPFLGRVSSQKVQK